MRNFTFQDWTTCNSFLKVWQAQGFSFQLESEQGKLPIIIRQVNIQEKQLNVSV